MIILLVSLSVIYLQMLTARRTRQPDSFDRLKTSRCMGGNYRRHLHSLRYHISYLAPQSINRPIKELTDGILEIANRNYEKRLNISDKNEEFKNVVDSFNRMAQHLAEYRSTTLSTLLAHKNFSKQLSIASAIP